MARSNNAPFMLIGAAVLLVVGVVVSFLAFDIETISGNEIGVKETWSEGVVETPLQPKTYFLFPGWSQKIYHYSLAPKVFVMNDRKDEKEAEGREDDAYLVQSIEGQDMWVSLNLRWRLDPEKIVWIHKNIREHQEERLIRPVLLRVVKDYCTRMKATDAYSGDGLVNLQSGIEKALMDPKGELRQNGVIVENFVIEHIKLNPKYIDEITARQVASQQKLRADEETKASEALALKAKADAQADYNKRVVEAERDKAVAIAKAEQEAQAQVLAAEAQAKQVGLAAQADANRVIIAAKANAEQVTVAADAEQKAAQAKATAIEAIGKAEADAKKLQLGAYAVPGADAFVQIEVAKAMASGFQNINGYLPQNMGVNVLSENFLNSIKTLVGPNKPQAPAAPAK